MKTLFGQLEHKQTRTLSRQSIEELAAAFSPFPEDEFPPKPNGFFPAAADPEADALLSTDDPSLPPAGEFEVIPDGEKGLGRPNILHLLRVARACQWSPEDMANLLKRHGFPQYVSPYEIYLVPHHLGHEYSDVALWIYYVLRILQVPMSDRALSLVMAAYIRDNPEDAIRLFKDYCSHKQVGIRMYQELLKAFLLTGNLEEAKYWFQQLVFMNSKHPEPLHAPTYEVIMRLFIALDDVDTALRIYESMVLDQVDIPRSIFHLLIRACGSAGYLHHAFSILQDMKASNVGFSSPDEATYLTMINACRECRDWRAEARMKVEREELHKLVMLQRKPLIGDHRNGDKPKWGRVSRKGHSP